MQPTTTKMLRKRGGNAKADVELRVASFNRDLARATRAIEEGADPDSTVGGRKYEQETNALNNAARNKASDIVRLLL